MEEMEHAQAMFVDESLDLLQEMESALNQLKAEPDNGEMINLVFRAAHTIKGSAGLFGFDEIVAFTHTVENVLEQVRAGERVCDDALVATLLSCRDHIESLIEQLGCDKPERARELEQHGQELLAQLAVTVPEKAGDNPTAVEPGAEQHSEQVQGQGSQMAGNACWHLSLRFGRDVLRNGMDPLSFIRYLASLGDIVEIVPLFHALPCCNEIDPESCYLGLELQLDSNADHSTLMSVFEFVADECQIHILPPYCELQQYVQLLDNLEQDPVEFGQVLVSCGALTPDELEQVRALQKGSIQPALPTAEPAPVPDLEPESSPITPAADSKPVKVKEPKRQENRSLRVDAYKLDQLINLVGELVIAGANTSLLARQNGDPELTLHRARFVYRLRDLRSGMPGTGSTCRLCDRGG